MKYLVAAALAATTMVGGVAVAAPLMSTSVRADTNGDRAISRAEFLARAEARFTRLDTDKNGSITREERRGGRHARFIGAGTGQDRMGAGGGGMLQRFDTDRDGKLSKTEFSAQAAQRWQRMDANGNGTIDADERRGRGMAAITDRASFEKRTAERFARVDANGDGYIDGAEASAITRGLRSGGKPPAPASN